MLLTGGSMFERLRRRSDLEFDPDIAHAALIYDEVARPILEAVHGEYIDVATRHGVPMLISSSTWRASRERVARSRYAECSVNQDNVLFARTLAAAHATPGAPLLVAGMLGPRGNAYRPQEALDPDASCSFHEYQVQALAEAEPDLIMAVTLPALSEARGMARVLGDTGLPYLMSFVVRDTGTLLDGTPLTEALDRIDGDSEHPPRGYMVNCVHPEVLGRCLEAGGEALTGRIIGLRANTSTLRPEELEGTDALITQAPGELAQHMLAVRRRHGLKIVGGCCGTGTDHIEQIAAHCKGSAQ